MILTMNKIGPIFKRDTLGNIRSWAAETSNDGAWRVTTGIIDGKKVISDWKYVTAKNIGRSNERDIHAQALFEANAEYNKKLEKGYFTDTLKIDTYDKFKPMLANDYAKLKKPLEYPVISQPKLDGIRCIARADGLWTRAGKPHVAVPHIWEALKPFFEHFPDIILDGELYNHDLRDDFNTITSTVRKTKPTKADLIKSEQLVQYHVYDCFDPYVPEWGLKNRRAFLYSKADLRGYCNTASEDYVQLVPNVITENDQELNDHYSAYIGLGYEGQMIRIEGSEYQKKRSKFLLKRKEFITEEYKVIGVEEGLGNWSGAVKRFKLIDSGGNHFSAGVRGSFNELAQLLECDVYPEWCTLRYFELTPDGIPRFPVVIDWGWGERTD